VYGNYNGGTELITAPLGGAMILFLPLIRRMSIMVFEVKEKERTAWSKD
jgi:hypothetical protein